MKLLPSAPKISSTTKKISADSIRSSDGTSGKGIYISKKKLISVRSRVIKIEKILGAQNKLYEKQKKKASVEQEKETRSKQESNLEKKPEQEDKGSKNLLKGPKLGFLDRIKNFIGKLLVGFIAIRLLPYLPDLIRLLPKVVSVVDWVSDFGIGLVDGFGSFVKGAYDLRDKTIGFIDSFGGDFAVNLFTKFEGAVGKVIEAAIIVAMSSGGEGGLLDTGIDLLKDRFLGQGAQAAASQAGGTASQAAGVGAGAAAAIIGGVGLLSSALGEGAFQLRGKGREIEGSAKKNYEQHKDKWKIDPRRVLSWGLYQAARFGNTMLSTVGFLLDVVGAPFRYAIELIRYPFLSDADKKTQAKNLAKFDARIREDIRKALNMVTFGAAFKEKGSFGNMFGDDAAQKEMMGKMAGGGLTRGGEKVGSVSRGIKSQKTPPRVFAQKSKETKIQPGSDIGGEKNIVKVFPESKDTSKVSPLSYVEDVNKKVSVTPFLGPIFGLAYKTLLGEKPDTNDYKNTASGLDKWVRYTFNLKGAKMRLAGGGEVDVDMLMQGEDMTYSLTKNVEGILSNNLTLALNDLKKQLGLKQDESQGKKGPEAGEETTGTAGQFSPEGLQGDIYKYLLSKGLDDNKALGIMANIHRESGFRPGVSETGGPGVGLFQYSSGGRKSAFLKAVPDYATNWKGQVDFALKDDVGPQYLTKSFGSPQEAADWWMRYWERPAEYIQNDKGPKIHARYLSGLQKYKTGQGYQIPTSVQLGAGRASSVGQFDAIASKFGLTMTSSYRPGDPGFHGKNRARDYSNDAVGNGTPQQLAFAKELVKQYGSSLAQLIYTPLGFGIANGKRVGLDYWGSATNAAHYHHVHVALAKGGRVPKPTYALIGEAGPEFVIDADSTKALENNFPGFLDALNHAKYNDAIGVLRNYASYEAGADQTVQLTTNVINNIVQSQPQKSAVMVSGGGSVDDYGEALAAGQ